MHDRATGENVQEVEAPNIDQTWNMFLGRREDES